MEEWLEKVPLEKDYYDHYLYPDDEFTAAIEEWCEYCPNVLNWEGHNKIGVSVFDLDAKQDYFQMLQIYSSIEHLNISPSLIHNEILYDKYPIFVYLLVTEKYGEDLGKIFGVPEYTQYSSNKLLEDEILFEMAFPKNRIPNEILSQVKEILIKFHDLGWIHNDVWPPNLLLKDRKVKIIDFEHCTQVSSIK